MDTSSEFGVTLAYIIACICLIIPPREITSLGFTVQNIFSTYLGVEDLHFIIFHLRRTAVTLLVHSVLPLGYYVLLGVVSPERNLFDFKRNGLIAKLSLMCAVGILVCAIITVRYWSWKQWKNHPLVCTLSHHSNSWRDVAAQINVEFRRIDKFSSHIGGTSVYITESWIIKCTAYKIDIAHKPDVLLNIVKADEHSLSVETNSAVQYLNIQVQSINSAVKPFIIRLNAMDYSELREKIQNPIRNARNVVIHQSLSDQFVRAFREQVEQNPRYHLDRTHQEPEPCIGCMQQTSNIKLQKLCAQSDVGECVQCYCRPMWCLQCMGKWFASRQDQNTPGHWMSASSPCPTCRSKFCVLDVCLVV